MDPLITNETGLNVNTTVATLKPFLPKAAIQNSLNDNLHKLSYSEKIKKGKESEYKIAFPNDRAKSLGPFNRKDKFKCVKLFFINKLILNYFRICGFNFIEFRLLGQIVTIILILTMHIRMKN